MEMENKKVSFSIVNGDGKPKRRHKCDWIAPTFNRSFQVILSLKCIHMAQKLIHLLVLQL